MDFTGQCGWPSSAEATFNNFVVMRILVNIVETKELPHFRLINKICNFVGTRALKYRTPQIKFTNDKKMTTFIETMETRNPLLPFPYGRFNLFLGNISLPKIRQFVDKFSNEVIEYEFTHSNLKEFEIPPFINGIPQDILLDVSIRQNFIQKIATFLSGSENNLEKVVFKYKTNIGIFPEELLNFPPIFSNLHTIKSLDSTKNSEGSFQIVTLLAQRAPILQTMDTKLSSFLRVLPPNFFMSHKYPPSPRMSIECDWLSSVSNQAIEHLIKGGYNNIVHFSFSINSQNFLQSQDLVFLIHQLNEFFQIQKNFLESLKITIKEHMIDFPSEEYRIQFPILIQLKEYTLNHLATEDDILDPYIYIEPLTTAQFPNLQKLTIQDIWEFQDKIFSPNTIMPSVRRLSINTYKALYKSLHLILPNLSHLEFRKIPSILTLDYVLTHLTQIKTLNLGNVLPNQRLKNPADFWYLYTGEAERLSKTNFNNLCSGKSTAEVLEIDRGEDGFYEIGSLANLEELTELCVTISSPLELEALVFMSRPGKMKRLKKLTIVYAKLPQGRIQYYEKVRKYFLINTASKRKYLNLLKAYHQNVVYSYIISGRRVPTTLLEELEIEGLL